MAGKFLRTVLVLCTVSLGTVLSSHFRGGAMQWRPLDNSGKVEITHRTSWRRSMDPPSNWYCDDDTIANDDLLGDEQKLECRSGCTGGAIAIGTMDFYCIDYSVSEDWTSGARALEYTFPSDSTAFEASFKHSAWLDELVIGGGGKWELQIKGDLTVRSDTGSINNSPVTSMNPILMLQSNCDYEIQIPVSDADNDEIRCRWAEGSLGECADVCSAFPYGEIDNANCTLTVGKEGPKQTGSYVVALQIEDFKDNSDTPMSSIPLQFLVEIYDSTDECGAGPVFVPPTPKGNETVDLLVGSTWTQDIVATSEGRTIVEIVTSSPSGMTKSDLEQIPGTENYMVTMTWTPTESQVGNHILCFFARDDIGVTSEQRCVIFIVYAEYPPTVTDQPDDLLDQTPETDVSFSITATGTEPLYYQWQKNESDLTDGGRISGATTNMLHISSIMSDDEGGYMCEVTNHVGSDVSDTAQLTIQLIVDLPPTVVDQPDDQLNQIPRSNVSFSITATGTEPLSYQWQKDGADLSNTDYIEGVTTTTLVVRDITKADEGAYRCVVTNHVGVDKSDTAQMSIVECMPGSCAAVGCSCRTSDDGCRCDDCCQMYGDCCGDFLSICHGNSEECTLNGCQDYAFVGLCWCDDDCETYGDCCSDIDVCRPQFNKFNEGPKWMTHSYMRGKGRGGRKGRDGRKRRNGLASRPPPRCERSNSLL